MSDKTNVCSGDLRSLSGHLLSAKANGPDPVNPVDGVLTSSQLTVLQKVFDDVCVKLKITHDAAEQNLVGVAIINLALSGVTCQTAIQEMILSRARW